MAEIRKHNPKTRDQIDAAILAALGEDMRHTAPGDEARPLSKPAPRKPTATTTFALGMGGAGWTTIDAAAVAKSTPKPAPSTEDNDDDELDAPDDDAAEATRRTGTDRQHPTAPRR